MKGAVPAGLNIRPGTDAALKPKGKGKGKKPKWVVVGRGKTKIPGGATRKIKLNLNKAGAAVLEKRGKATIKVTVTIKIPGEATVKQSHTIRVYLKKKKTKR